VSVAQRAGDWAISQYSPPLRLQRSAQDAYPPGGSYNQYRSYATGAQFGDTAGGRGRADDLPCKPSLARPCPCRDTAMSRSAFVAPGLHADRAPGEPCGGVRSQPDGPALFWLVILPAVARVIAG